MKIHIKLFIIALALVTSGCLLHETDWIKTSRADNVSTYRVFMKRHPFSVHTAEVRARIVQIEWNEALSVGDVEALRWFIQNHPNSSYAVEAQGRINALAHGAWVKTRDEDTAQAYETFLQMYPESYFAPIARERMERKMSQ